MNDQSFKNIISYNGRLFLKRFFIALIILINQVYSVSFDSIPFFVDQVDHSVYFLDISTKIMQSDKKYGAIIIDATKRVPYGSYLMRDDFISDTLKTYNYFSWKQGDYLLRDLLLGSKYILSDSSEIYFNAQGRSFPGKNAMQGPDIINYSNNSLQNYYLDYKKKYQTANMNFGIFYHLEDVGLPISKNEYNNRLIESIHLGSSYNIVLNNMNINFQYYLESGLVNYTDNLEYSSDLLILKTEYKKNLFCISSNIYMKDFSTYINDSLFINSNINNFSFYFEPLFEKNYYKFGLDINEKKIYLNLDIAYPFYNYKIKFSKINNFSNFLNKDFGNIYLMNNNAELKSLSVIFSKEKIYSELMLSNSKFNNQPNTAYQFISKIFFNKNYINFRYLYQDEESFMINRYSNLNIHFEPNLFWTEKYKLFFDFNYFYYKTSNDNDFNSLNILYSQIKSDGYNDSFINNEFGLIVDNFKLTYCNHFISENDFIVSDGYLPIKPISFFKVDWIFTD